MSRAKILIIQRRSGIGDMCAFLPFIRKISEIRKNYQITILTSKKSKSDQLLNNDPDINNIFFYEDYKNIFKLFTFFRKNQFKQVYIFHYSLRLFLLSVISGIKEVFIYGLFKKNKNIIKEARNFTLKSLKIKKSEHSFLCKIYTKNPSLIRENKIVIGIGGSGYNKKWPIKYFQHLIEKINLRKKYIFYLAGGLEEKLDADHIKKAFPNIEIVSMCEVTISESIEIIKDAKLYIGNDTGFMHICGSLGIKSFGLFGDTPVNYAEYNDLILPIIPNNYQNVGHDSLAMNKISVDHVFNQIEKFI